MNRFVVSEAYDFEFKARWKPGTRFVLNSVWQGNLDYQTNLYNSKLVRRKMRDEIGLDVLKIIGRYAEQLGDVECMVSFPSEDAEDELIRRFFYYYGRRYRQNSIFWVDESDIVWILPTRPNSTYGQIGRFIRGERFTYQHFVPLVEKFMAQTYVFDKVKILTD